MLINVDKYLSHNLLPIIMYETYLIPSEKRFRNHNCGEEKKRRREKRKERGFNIKEILKICSILPSEHKVKQHGKELKLVHSSLLFSASSCRCCFSRIVRRGLSDSRISFILTCIPASLQVFKSSFRLCTNNPEWKKVQESKGETEKDRSCFLFSLFSSCLLPHTQPFRAIKITKCHCMLLVYLKNNKTLVNVFRWKTFGYQSNNQNQDSFNKMLFSLMENPLITKTSWIKHFISDFNLNLAQVYLSMIENRQKIFSAHSRRKWKIIISPMAILRKSSGQESVGLGVEMEFMMLVVEAPS